MPSSVNFSAALLVAGEQVDSVIANYSQSPSNPSSSSCSQKTLPMPSVSEPILAKVFTLEDGSYFLSLEQDDFITMGVLLLTEWGTNLIIQCSFSPLTYFKKYVVKQLNS